MENEDWDVMPGVTYVKGFLRTYSTYLGLDPDVIIGEFRSRAMVPSTAHEAILDESGLTARPYTLAAW
jgi:cytoskeleton protein RodZ